MPPASARALQPGGDIDAVAEDVAVLDHDVADIDADAEQQPLLGRLALVRHGERVLDLHGAIQRVDDAGEFRQHAVAGGAGDPAVMESDQLVDDRGGGRQGGQRRRLVPLHLAAVAFDIGGEDGDQLAFQAGRFQSASCSLCDASARVFAAQKPGGEGGTSSTRHC